MAPDPWTPAACGDSAGRLRVTNEFATVDIRLRQLHSGAVLELTDPRSGAVIRLDALELEALTRLSDAQRRALVDPSAAHTGGPGPDIEEGMVGW